MSINISLTDMEAQELVLYLGGHKDTADFRVLNHIRGKVSRAIATQR